MGTAVEAKIGGARVAGAFKEGMPGISACGSCRGSPEGIAEAVAGRDLGGDDGSDKWGRLVRLRARTRTGVGRQALTRGPLTARGREAYAGAGERG